MSNIDIDLEINILNLMLNETKQSYIIENLDKKYFEDYLNQRIFDCAKQLYYNDQFVDLVLLKETLQSNDTTIRLLDISEVAPLSVQAEKFCVQLVNKYLNKLIKSAKNKKDIEEIIKLKESLKFEDTKIKHISEGIETFPDKYLQNAETAVNTGFKKLDTYIGSFMGGDYIALGGSTGTGKTSLALNLAAQFCLQEKSVLYFSLEMPLEQLQNRFVCMLNGLNALKYRNFGFNFEEMQLYKQGLEDLKQWKLNVVCDYNLTCEKMKKYIKEQKNKELDFVIIDYLGLIQGYGNKSLYEKSTNISRNIKLIATELKIPILVLVQLNRNLKERQDKTPVLSDIRESGAIEQDADFVLFAHREGIYDKDIDPKILQLIIAKNRHGESNKNIKLFFDINTQKIKEFDNF